MKQANNNEVDLLLRSLARQRDKSGSENGSSLDGRNEGFAEHLDADELNSYAEGVVPEPARGRYVEHLADCEACRSIVIDLSQAAGASARYEVSQPQGGTSFWQTVLAMFSPAVLRFGVPVLLLTAVIGIGFVAFWQQRGSEFVAMRSKQDSQVQTEPANDSKAANPAPSETAPPASPASGFTKSGDIQTQKAQSKLQEKESLVAKEVTTLDSTVAKGGAKDAGRAGEGAGLITSQPYSPEPKADAAAAPPVTSGVAQKSAEVARVRPEKREDQDRARDEFRNQDEEHGPSRSRNNAAAPASQRNVGSLSARGPNVDKKKASEVESRSISGRRFTREGNAWVDIDYNSPRATVNVTRGSDQFRALVADEPGIRAIADQLSGVVIVVWKNRAYRIQ
jgi:hypothetical protein